MCVSVCLSVCPSVCVSAAVCVVCVTVVAATSPAISVRPYKNSQLPSNRRAHVRLAISIVRSDSEKWDP